MRVDSAVLTHKQSPIKETMDMEMNPRLRQRALKQLRQAVYHQIKLWECAMSLEEVQKLDLDEILSQVQQISITADTGMELQEKDLDDFLALESQSTSGDQSWTNV
jgi:hypothetical protein